MSRLIDVDKLISSLGWLVESGMTGNKTKAVLKLAIQTADGQPTVDAVEVIRCKDCRYYDAENHNCLDELGYARVWEEDDYCSFAERREER